MMERKTEIQEKKILNKLFEREREVQLFLLICLNLTREFNQRMKKMATSGEVKFSWLRGITRIFLSRLKKD